MDETLAQILRALYAATKERDALREEVAALQAAYTDLRAKQEAADDVPLER